MGNCNANWSWRKVEELQARLANGEGLPFSELLDPEMVTQVLERHEVTWVDRIYTPQVTLWVFLSQALDADGSCRAAVARLLAHRLARGERPCSAQTGAYCQARARLPEEVLADLVRQTGAQQHQRVGQKWQWKGRRVKVFDGSTISMPDTPANQQAYPQHPSQQQGVGFPLARMAVVFCLFSGVVMGLALRRFAGQDQSELSMFRELLDLFFPGDVMLGDRGVCSWFELALLKQKGVDAVVRLHQRRPADFRYGRRLGKKDRLVVWPKPPRPAWMDQATYEELPEELEIRLVEVVVQQPGFRSRRIVLATTLLDASEYTKSELGELYRLRWQAELNLRSLKSTLRMEPLRCQTPQMVHKEIWIHLLAYNLIRQLILEAAEQHGLSPLAISFAGALQTLAAFQLLLATANAQTLPRMYEQILHAVASNRVGNRADRCEPRAVKRRPKPYPLLTIPRAKARKKLCCT